MKSRFNDYRLLILCFVCSALLLGCGTNYKFDLTPEEDVSSTSLELNKEVDVLWVIDSSASMSKHQEALAQQVSVFNNGLRDTKLDFRMGVINMDTRDFSRFIGTPSVLNNGSAQLDQTMYDRFLSIGEGGSTIEEGLATMKEALQRESRSSASSFFRKKSLLVVIFLTNEDDKSPSDNYLQFLDLLKPPLPSGERSWVAHFIGVLPDQRKCSTLNSFFQPGLKYIELVKASGGITADLCQGDLSAALSDIKARVVEFVTDIPLEREPVLASLKVFVNGRKVPQDPLNGWTYQAQGRYIRFHGTAIPTVDAQIKIDYDPVGIK